MERIPRSAGEPFPNINRRISFQKSAKVCIPYPAGIAERIFGKNPEETSEQILIIPAGGIAGGTSGETLARHCEGSLETFLLQFLNKCLRESPIIRSCNRINL